MKRGQKVQLQYENLFFSVKNEINKIKKSRIPATGASKFTLIRASSPTSGSEEVKLTDGLLTKKAYTPVRYLLHRSD